MDGDAFDTATCGYLASLTADTPPATMSSPSPGRAMLAGLAVDGKTLRGSRTTDTTVHLLAAMRHDTQIVLAQQQIEAKSNEIPAFAPLLSGLDLTSVVVTADALHTQQEHARQIIAAGGHYLFIAKGNQPTLHRRLKTLPWREAVL
ncbi:ISAs1 family transposase, partial [Nonomuraea sp. H19]|uniref:ISAs1 family transposase n=1 Tax=Nonomuraea sp. H19 TaxID=3452206 RepID=UPI003F8B1631